MSINKFGKSKGGHHRKEIVQLHTNFFSLTQDGDYDVDNHKLINVKTPTDKSDCVNKIYVDDTILHAGNDLKSTMKIELNLLRTQILDKIAEVRANLKQDIDELEQEITIISKEVVRVGQSITKLNTSVQQLKKPTGP
jgi:predicted RecB family endonuclease